MKELFGAGVALATPLNDDYSVDYEGLERLVKHVLDGDADYLVVQGTTGESPVFSWDEKLRILDFVLEKNAGKKPVVFGHGGNDTQTLIDTVADLSRYPLAAILSVSPYYSRPSQQGILRHYELLADASPYPIILYNVPARTAGNVEASTTLALAEHKNIIAMKEASGDLKQCQQIIAEMPEEFMLLSGDDQTTFELIGQGASGVISVVANVLPEIFGNMVHARLEKDEEKARTLDQYLQPAYHLCGEEGNPSSVKTGLEALGICARTVKTPLFNGSDQLLKRWKHYLSSSG
ncbi:MAG: 4-hydroxy-tetrahydrodipicolinate synthase [Bacteroidota bacterium]